MRSDEQIAERRHQLEEHYQGPGCQALATLALAVEEILQRTLNERELGWVRKAAVALHGALRAGLPT